MLEEVALSAQHPQPASPSLLCWGGLRHSPVPLQLLQPLLDAGVKAAPAPDPASIPQVLINISPAVITGVWGWPPCLLRGSLCWAEPSKTLPGARCLLSAGSNQLSSSWGNRRHPQTELCCPSISPVPVENHYRETETMEPSHWAPRGSRRLPLITQSLN